MINLTVNDLINYCDCKLLIGDKNKVIGECYVNSKLKINDGCFFGIKGEKVDGSLFYKEAFDNGASICVINKIYDLDLNGYDNKTVLIAKDTLYALQKLAVYKRSLFNGEVIGITGSIGKTTTRKLIQNVLEKKYGVLSTNGNENSQIGLSLTILRYKNEDIMLLEMGMNELGQIHNLSMIAKPTISVITNIYDSHIGNLGSIENILKAKLEILDGMEKGTLLLNNDNDMLKEVVLSDNDIKLLKYGLNNESDIMVKNIKEDIDTTFDIDSIENIRVSGGKSFIYNALPAILIGKILNIPDENIKEGINTFKNEKHRLEMIKLDNNVTIIDDCYNASYESVKAALEYISNFNKRKIAVLADIKELGKLSRKIHLKIGNEVIKNNIDILITIGKDSKLIGKTARKKGFKSKNIKHFCNEKKSRIYIKKLLKQDDIILIKGSNSMNLINLVNFLKE